MLVIRVERLAAGGCWIVVCLVRHFVFLVFLECFGCLCFNVDEEGCLVLSEWLCDVYIESTSLWGRFAPCIVNAAKASQSRRKGI